MRTLFSSLLVLFFMILCSCTCSVFFEHEDTESDLIRVKASTIGSRLNVRIKINHDDSLLVKEISMKVVIPKLAHNHGIRGTYLFRNLELGRTAYAEGLQLERTDSLALEAYRASYRGSYKKDYHAELIFENKLAVMEMDPQGFSAVIEIAGVTTEGKTILLTEHLEFTGDRKCGLGV